MFASYFLGLYLFIGLVCVITNYYDIGQKIKITKLTSILAIIINGVFLSIIYKMYVNIPLNQTNTALTQFVFMWIVFDCMCGLILSTLNYGKSEIDMTKTRVYITNIITGISCLGILLLYFTT